jgi:hypothetical protein
VVRLVWCSGNRQPWELFQKCPGSYFLPQRTADSTRFVLPQALCQTAPEKALTLALTATVLHLTTSCPLSLWELQRTASCLCPDKMIH